MFNPILKGNVQGAFAEPELLNFRKPKRVVQNKNNGHKNSNNSHNIMMKLDSIKELVKVMRNDTEHQ